MRDDTVRVVEIVKQTMVQYVYSNDNNLFDMRNLITIMHGLQSRTRVSGLFSMLQLTGLPFELSLP